MKTESARRKDEAPVVTAKPTAAGSDLFSSPQKRSAILCLLLVLITLALYNPIVHNQFIDYDDGGYIFQNQHVQAGIRWSTVRWAFTTYEVANWHPLTWLSHALDWQLFKSNPAGHHYMSALFHALNTILLFLLLQRATGFPWRSLMVAALFAVHPVNVESVAWAAERKNVLSMMFFLLAMLAYGAYVRRPSLRSYSLVVLSFALGLMAKPQVITLPCVLLLWDYWPLQRLSFSAAGQDSSGAAAGKSFSWLVLEKVPLFALAAASAVITMHAQRAGYAVRSITEYSLYGRLGNSIVSYVRYIGHAFWPLHLSPAYPHLGDGIPVWQVVVASAFLLIVSVLVMLSRKPYLVVGWLWFLGTMFPMAGIIQVGDQAMADRYAYIPFIGLFWMAVWSVAEGAHDWHVESKWLAAPACAVILFCSFVSHRQLSYWQDGETLWRYALTVTEGNFIAHSNLARVLALSNRYDEAIVEFTAAEELHNYALPDVLRFGDFEMRHGHMAEATNTFRKVLRSTQDHELRDVAYTDLGLANARLGDNAQAKENFENALQINPQDAAALLGLGLLAYRSGDFVAAAGYFSHGVSTKPTDLGYLLLGTALQRSGRVAEADAAYAEAQRISPDLTQAQQTANQYLY
jgi:protein O-mannosyl-transferase